MDFRRMKRAAVFTAVASVLALHGVAAVGQDLPDGATEEPTTASPPPAQRSPFGEKYYSAVPPTERRPLMSLLERANLSGPLDDARIRIFGHVEAGYTFNPDDPVQDLNLGRVFDVEANQFVFNQADLNVERTVNLSGSEFDVGGRVEFLYGSDARFIHSNGMFDNQDFFDGPENQFDIPQLYTDVNLPVGNGLRIRAGKFLFFKQIDPNASVFYSHSYTFGGALPFTLTGATAYYELNEQWGAELGVNRGWGQSLEDNNDMVSFHGRIRYSPSDRTSFAVLFITGPEMDDNNGAYRTAIDFVGSHRVTDDFTVMFDLVYGRQSNPQDELFPLGLAGQDEADWYGAAGYAIYKIDERFSVAGRLEWFRDEEGFVPVTAVPQDLFEATLGVTITPMPTDEIGRHLKIRPEVRYDWSTENYFDGLTSDNQFTAAVDVIFNF
jgi:Putative beta-barrel porin-2, OmpL-like. bbp2